MVGTKAKDPTVNPGTFTFGATGEWVGGPIVKNRLFFFEGFENETTTQPATLWLAAGGSGFYPCAPGLTAFPMGPASITSRYPSSSSRTPCSAPARPS